MKERERESNKNKKKRIESINQQMLSSKGYQITRQKNIDLASVSRTRRSEQSSAEYELGLDEDTDDDYLRRVAAAAAAAAGVMVEEETFEEAGSTSASVTGEDEPAQLKNEFELINESLSKLTTRLIADDPDAPACFSQFDFNSSTIAAINAAHAATANNSNNTINTPTSSSSSSSPSNIPNNTNTTFLNTPVCLLIF